MDTPYSWVTSVCCAYITVIAKNHGTRLTISGNAGVVVGAEVAIIARSGRWSVYAAHRRIAGVERAFVIIIADCNDSGNALSGCTRIIFRTCISVFARGVQFDVETSGHRVTSILSAVLTISTGEGL